MASRSALITVMAGAAYKAARGLIRDFGEVENLQVSLKGPRNFVTAADLQAEKVLHAELSRARPGFGFLLEESGTIEGGDPRRRWIVDPLDGTINFLHGIPHFAISIALERDRQIVAGVVYDPLRDELFRAEQGVGAYLNDRRLRVSARRTLADAVVAVGKPGRRAGERPDLLIHLEGVAAETVGVRRFGSASLDLAYVSAGRFDGFWQAGLAPWDLAAGILLVREAGGYVTDLEGGDDVLGTGGVLAANPTLHPQLLRLVRREERAAGAAGRP
ncbi:MAG: inositol monophosphatase family protein [Alphaproteobacteria bacterium]